METRSSEKIYLIEHDESQIIGAKLPSNGQVLKVLFYNMRKVKLNLRSSAYLVVKEIEVLWEKARIPTKKLERSVQKVESLYQRWKILQKTCKRRTAVQELREKEFISNMDELFDIAHGDALDIMSIEEDKLFLLNQRKNGRRGAMLGGDNALFRKEERIQKRIENEQLRQKLHESQSIMTNSAQYDSDDNNDDDDNDNNLQPYKEYDDLDYRPSCSQSVQQNKRQRRMQNFITPKLVATLDKCKLSDRDSVRILIATAQALNHDVNDLVISKTSIRLCRKQLRTQIVNRIQTIFKEKELQAITVHWDGKIFPSGNGKEKVERLPVLITSSGFEKLLGVPLLTGGTGKHQAEAVFELLEENELTTKVQALCFDTTATNTGRLKGACVLLEQKLGRELMYFPCRHHIYEIILRSIFENQNLESKGPTLSIFHRFQGKWAGINQKNYQNGMIDSTIASGMNNSSEILEFVKSCLDKKYPRADYKELLELTLIFLGHNIENYNFKVPGAFHHARWMSKAIYALKIFLFRHEFSMTKAEMESMQEICLFICKLYIKPWMEAPVAAKAPQQDLDFVKNLLQYRTINKNLAELALKKLSKHLWYLSPEAVALSFFDSDLTYSIRAKMVKKLSTDCSNDCKRLMMGNMEEFQCKNIDEFVSYKTLTFFRRFGIDTSFMDKDPTEWEFTSGYQKGLEIISNINVINDSAERSVRLMEEYNNTLSHDEKEKQNIMKIVAHYRKEYESINKSALSDNL